MFGSRFGKAKSDVVSGFLGSQTEFTGKLSFSGVVHLDGNFEGEIISRGVLVVGAGSVVHARISSNVLKISGEVHGDLEATEKIEMYPPAKVYGNIRTPSLTVEDGVSFNGTCTMSAAVVELPELTVPPAASGDDREAEEAISAHEWLPEYGGSDELEREMAKKRHLLDRD